MSNPIWTPSPARIAASNLARFAVLAREHHGAPKLGRDPVQNWATLWQWSVDERGAFWAALAAFANWRAEHGPGSVLEHGDRMPGARWFTGTRLNFAENLLSRRDAHTALVFVNEEGMRRSLSYLELHAQVARVAAGLAACGVGPGVPGLDVERHDRPHDLLGVSEGGAALVHDVAASIACCSEVR